MYNKDESPAAIKTNLCDRGDHSGATQVYDSREVKKMSEKKSGREQSNDDNEELTSTEQDVWLFFLLSQSDMLLVPVITYQEPAFFQPE